MDILQSIIKKNDLILPEAQPQTFKIDVPKIPQPVPQPKAEPTPIKLTLPKIPQPKASLPNFKLTLPKIPQPKAELNPIKLTLPKIAQPVPQPKEEPTPIKLILPKIPQLVLQPKVKFEANPKAPLPDFKLTLPKTPQLGLQHTVKNEPISRVDRKDFKLALPKTRQFGLQHTVKNEPISRVDRKDFKLALPTVKIPMINNILTEKEEPKQKYTFTKPENQTETEIQEIDTVTEVTETEIQEIDTVSEETIPANISRMQYTKPKRNDLAVLLVFFDYIGSARILINYLYMVEKLKLANIPVFTLELVIRGKNPKIYDAMHVYGSSYLFQKEHLIRLLERSIPENYTKLVFLDADVIFDNPTWYDELSMLLDTNHVVQCFKTCYWLDLSYTKVEKSAISCVFADRSKRFWDPQQPWQVHPGFAWAFERDHYRSFGFFDKAVIGSGDTLFAYGIFGYPLNVYDRETRIYTPEYTKWMSRIKELKVTCLEGNLYHLYHGPIPSRQYVSRYEAFKGISNIEDIISVNIDGVYELSQLRLNKPMLDFFKTRNDDGL